jgi:hypothetical protein
MHIQEENMLNNKSVKISERKLESVNRRTEHTMAKENRKKDKQRSTKHYTSN